MQIVAACFIRTVSVTWLWAAEHVGSNPCFCVICQSEFLVLLCLLSCCCCPLFTAAAAAADINHSCHASRDWPMAPPTDSYPEAFDGMLR
jgi:hypothetical protein